MADPWLSIIGIGEDGLSGLPPASRAALDAAEVVFGAQRHLTLAGISEPDGLEAAADPQAGDWDRTTALTQGAAVSPQATARARQWPVPFDLGPVLVLRGRRVAMLVSGDPFWHGAGGAVAGMLPAGAWRAFPAAGTFSLVAARLGWRIEEVFCLGLHAAPYERLRPVLARGIRVICTLRDAAAVPALADWLAANGFAATRITVCEALGGPRERLRAGAGWTDIAAPVAVALDGADLPRSAGLPRTPGLPDGLFDHDGQITKAPARALTLAALAPRPGEMLWDIGAGSGSVSVEWCLAGGRAIAVERRRDRAATIRRNAEAFGVPHRLTVIEGEAPAALQGLADADAVFVGGGGEAVLPEPGRAPDAEGDADGAGWLPAHARIVANAVTLEGEARLAALHARLGGRLLRIELATAARLGGYRSWQPARPLVQWSWP